MADGSIPSAHALRSAREAVRALHPPETSRADARESFRRLPTGGLFTGADYDTAEEVLRSVDLVQVDGDMLVVSESVRILATMPARAADALLLDLILERRPPNWLRTAAGGSSLREAIVPDAELAAVGEILPDPDVREAILLRAARRFDAARLAALGAAGEDQVVEHCKHELANAGRAELADQVERVSLISDELGYDVVAPKLDGGNRRLEVKATRRLTWRTEIFLSRNEFEVGLTDPDWALVVCAIDDDDQVSILGWCRALQLENLVPEDRHPHGRWVSVSLLQLEGLLAADVPPP
jgi:hypothetical protein